MAFKIIYEFELTDKFPPVPVLKDCVVESKRLAAKIRQDGHFSLQSLVMLPLALRLLSNCLKEQA